jgi:beta-lactamase class A
MMRFRVFKKKRYQLVLTGFVCLVIGFIAGWEGEIFYEYNMMEVTRPNIVSRGHEKLINPLLECEVGADRLRQQQLKPFKNKVKQLIAERIKDKTAAKISVYFRDLDDGMTFNINGNEEYSPASLGKLPIMMAYFKLAENDPGLLKKKLKYDGKLDKAKEQYFKPNVTLEAGKSYTIDELIYRMIAYSDNNAWRILLDHIDTDYLNSVVIDLGAAFLTGPRGEPQVTVKSYSIFLRVLYNASYLNDEMSEKALEYLETIEFPFGIASSIPLDITVVNKFGERYARYGNEKQLHDFGIVYYPNSPYILCIMVKGDDFTKMAPILHEISQLIYAEVDAQHKASDHIH